MFFLNLKRKHTMNHIELGQEGEDIAANLLVQKGYQILTRNYRFKKAEIDIVCEFDNQLIIVEVKTRQTAAIGEPYKAVTISKQRQIIKVANKYIEETKCQLEVRLDVISIVLNQYGTRIEHIEDAFYP